MMSNDIFVAPFVDFVLLSRRKGIAEADLGIGIACEKGREELRIWNLSHNPNLCAIATLKDLRAEASQSFPRIAICCLFVTATILGIGSPDSAVAIATDEMIAALKNCRIIMPYVGHEMQRIH